MRNSTLCLLLSLAFACESAVATGTATPPVEPEDFTLYGNTSTNDILLTQVLNRDMDIVRPHPMKKDVKRVVIYVDYTKRRTRYSYADQHGVVHDEVWQFFDKNLAYTYDAIADTCERGTVGTPEPFFDFLFDATLEKTDKKTGNMTWRTQFPKGSDLERIDLTVDAHPARRPLSLAFKGHGFDVRIEVDRDAFGNPAFYAGAPAAEVFSLPAACVG